MARRDFDYYPTPPEAGLALRTWLASWCAKRGQSVVRRFSTVVDLGAGRGALRYWLGDVGRRWVGVEIQERFAPDLHAAGYDQVCIEHALRYELPRGAAIISNPTYGRSLDDWLHVISRHCRRKGARAFGAALTRATSWDDCQRDVVHAPDVLLRVRSRISFTGNGKSDSSAHAWAIWLPQQRSSTTVEWVDQGVPTDAQRRTWSRLAGVPEPPRQFALELRP